MSSILSFGVICEQGDSAPGGLNLPPYAHKPGGRDKPTTERPRKTVNVTRGDDRVQVGTPVTSTASAGTVSPAARPLLPRGRFHCGRRPSTTKYTSEMAVRLLTPATNQVFGRQRGLCFRSSFGGSTAPIFREVQAVRPDSSTASGLFRATVKWRSLQALAPVCVGDGGQSSVSRSRPMSALRYRVTLNHIPLRIPQPMAATCARCRTSRSDFA